MEKQCIVCGGMYDAYDRSGIGGHGSRMKSSKRRSDSITCSPKCSKIYNRISNYLNSTKRRKMASKKARKMRLFSNGI